MTGNWTLPSMQLTAVANLPWCACSWLFVGLGAVARLIDGQVGILLLGFCCLSMTFLLMSSVHDDSVGSQFQPPLTPIHGGSRKRELEGHPQTPGSILLHRHHSSAM